MDFAKSHLESFGWKEGKGLGKSEDGIKNSIKPKLKFDSHGIGFQVNEDNEKQWWNQAFNGSASGLKFKLTQTQNGIQLKNNSKTKTNCEINKNINRNYSNFVQSSESDVKNDNNIDYNCNDFEAKEQLNEKLTKNLDFDELFRRSDGRTGHKAARIGCQMNGKLKRIQEQEKQFNNKTKKLKTKR